MAEKYLYSIYTQFVYILNESGIPNTAAIMTQNDNRRRLQSCKVRDLSCHSNTTNGHSFVVDIEKR